MERPPNMVEDVKIWFVRSGVGKWSAIVRGRSQRFYQKHHLRRASGYFQRQWLLSQPSLGQTEVLVLFASSAHLDVEP